MIIHHETHGGGRKVLGGIDLDIVQTDDGHFLVREYRGASVGCHPPQTTRGEAFALLATVRKHPGLAVRVATS